MLLKTAIRIILHEKEKYSGAIAGIALAVFLIVLQWGFYRGYQRDITVVLDSVEADFWVIPKGQPLFDGWVTMDDLPYWRVLEHPEVEGASRVIWGYAAWRLPGSGGKDTVEVLGLEFDSGIGMTLDFGHPEPAALLRPDGHVLVGRNDRDKLGLSLPTGEDSVEIMGRRATPVGFIDGVRLFTTAGFVLTDLDNARTFLKVPASHTTYIVGKCRRGADPERVVRELQAAVPDHDVLLSQQFHDRAAEYWATRTGIGPVLALSSVLAVLVGFLIVMLAFYVSTIEKIPVFACLKALGASNGEIVTLLMLQVLVVFLLGCLLGGLGLHVAVELIARTNISVVITGPMIITGVGVAGACSAGSALLSIRRLVSADPGEAFRS